MTKLKFYPMQKRGGQGVFTARLNSKTGKLTVMRVLDHPHKEIVLISKQGHLIRSGIEDISTLSRQTSGVRIMRQKEGDKVAALAVLDVEPEESNSNPQNQQYEKSATNKKSKEKT